MIPMVTVYPSCFDRVAFSGVRKQKGPGEKLLIFGNPGRCNGKNDLFCRRLDAPGQSRSHHNQGDIG